MFKTLTTSVLLFMSLFFATFASGQSVAPTLGRNNNWTGVNNFLTGNLTLGSSSHPCPQGAGFFMTGYNADFSPICQAVSAGGVGVVSLNSRQGAIQLNGSSSVIVTEGPTGTFTFTSPNSSVVSINGATGPITLTAGTNISIVQSPSGTFTINCAGCSGGGGGSGTVSSGGPHNFTIYTGTNQPTVVPHPNMFEIDTTMSLSDINTLFGTANGSIVIPDGVLGAWTYGGTKGSDLRSGTHFHQMSQNGISCDAQFIGITLNGTTTVSGGPFFPSSVGQSLSIGAQIGGYNGTQWRFTPTITGYTDVNHVTISTAAPFSISEDVWMGTDNSTALNSSMTALGNSGTQAANGLVGLLPAGCQMLVLSPILWNHAQSFEGQAGNSTVIVDSPATDVLQVPDASGVNVSSPGLVAGHFTVIMDNSIDPSRPYTNVDASGTVTNPSPLYRPLGNGMSDSNDPTGPAYCIGCSNYVADITQNSAVACVPTGLGRLPTVGEQVMFRDTPAIFTSHVQSFAGSCPTGKSPVTLTDTVPNVSGYTLTQTEFVASTSTTGIQHLSVAIAAGTLHYPFTITVANPTTPVPGRDANAATHGTLKIGSDIYQYIGISYLSPYTYNIQNGPTTTSGWAVNTSIAPMNPCYAQQSTPWPVVPTVNAGDSTPSGARTFPGRCAGNAAISQPQVNGNVYSGGGFFRGHLDDIVVNSNNSDARNTSVGLYIAGNTQPYATTFSNFRMQGVAYCLAEGQASYGQHGIAFQGPTGQGDDFVDWSCTSQVPMFVMGNQDGNFTRVDAYGTLVNPFNGATIGAGEALYMGGSTDEQTGAGVQGCGGLTVTTWNAEPENGNHIEQPQYLDVQCPVSSFFNNSFEGQGANFIGSNIVVKGGQLVGSLTNPIIIYGNSNVIEQTTDSVTKKVGNVWGYSSVLNWGCYNVMASYSSYGGGAMMMPAPGMREMAYGYDNGSFRDGWASTTPYVTDKEGYFPPCDFAPNTSDPGPLQVNYTVDTSAPISGGYVGCNVGPGNVGCVTYHLGGFFGYYYIGQDQRVTTLPYVYQTAIKTTSNQAITLQVWAIDSGDPIDTCPGVSNVLNQTINTIGGQYTTFTYPVTFVGRSGCILEFSWQNATSTDVAQIAYVNFEPIPKLAYRNTVSNSIYNTSCSVPADLGTDGTYEYYCNGTTVKRVLFN